ncbi:MAG: glycosyltransferase [Candidatus Roizmanbacteria bacterium]|nr:MAG: glycosyltransferase [Candidatus Roizmanbacteria bacterium]
MKVSVVIPAYNEEKYIEKCLEALNLQEEKPEEIIIVDNNSTDNTINVAQNFNATIFKEFKQGITYARNKGFDEAKGDILARCDADSIPPSDWIKKIINDFSRYKIDAVTGPLKMYDFFLPTILGSIIYADIVRIAQKGKGTLIGPNMAITKKIWDKVKKNTCLEDKKVHEDMDLALHIGKAGGVIMFDKSLIMPTSARRIKKRPQSFFIEYPLRAANTIKIHPSK